MLIIYFLLGVGITTAHSDYGASLRVQHFDKTVQNIDKEAYVKHQREKRFVTGYFVPQNVTNKPQWGNLNITRNQMPFTGPSTTSRTNAQNANQLQFLNNGTLPNDHGNMTNVTGKYVNPVQDYNSNVSRPVYPTYYNYIKIRHGYNITGNYTPTASGYNSAARSGPPRNTPYPGYPSYPAPSTGYPVPNTGYSAPNTTGYSAPNTTGYPASNTNPGPNYNTTVNTPVYPNYNIIVRPVNKNNFNNSNPSGYNVQPINPTTPVDKPYYPLPNTGYPASNTGNLAPNTGYPEPNTVYPVPNTGYPAPNNRYPVPNTFYPPPSYAIPPANVTGFVPKPNPGFTIHGAAPRNNTNSFNNNGNGFNNSANGFNNTTASLADCKCKLPRANSTITKVESSMDACVIACNDCPTGMKMSALGVCVKDSDYDDYDAN